MHPQSGEERVKRNRYNIASVDVKTLQKSEPYKDIPDTIGIYITNADFLRTEKTVNKVVRVIEDTDKTVSNGVSEYYVSLRGNTGTKEQKELMQYILNLDGVLDNIYFPNLVKRVRFLKEEQEGGIVMCEIMDAIREEGRAEGREEGREEMKKLLIRMVENKIPEEMICAIASITREELQTMK